MNRYWPYMATSCVLDLSLLESCETMTNDPRWSKYLPVRFLTIVKYSQ